jgi:hypothetical protein
VYGADIAFNGKIPTWQIKNIHVVKGNKIVTTHTYPFTELLASGAA